MTINTDTPNQPDGENQEPKSRVDIRGFFRNIGTWIKLRFADKNANQARWYSAFTIFVLLLLIVFQVYWVIGNQLINQLEDLLQKETEVNQRIAQNQIAYSTLEIIYKQKEINTESFKASGTYSFYTSPEWERDTLQNLSEREQLQKELELVKAQLERNSTILLIWSQPWDDFIKNRVNAETLFPTTGGGEYPDLTTADKYALQIESIQAQISTIDLQLADDPDGEKEAARLNSVLQPELDSKESQLGQLYAENSELYIREAEVLAQINNIDSQLAAISSGEKTIEQLNEELNSQLVNLRTQKAAIDLRISDITSQLSTEIDANAQSALTAQLAGLQTEQKTIESQIIKIENQLKAISGSADTKKDLETELKIIIARKQYNSDQIQILQSQSANLISQLVPGGEIVKQWRADKQRLTDQLNALLKQAQADARRESSRQAQLVGQFVLVFLHSYILPLLYGVLGSSSYVLRKLSQQIRDKNKDEVEEQVSGQERSEQVSEHHRIQNPVRISLGALAGIMIGFIIPTDDATSFVGSVSPLALAFLVGYNIEFFFSLMDALTDRLKNLIKPNDENGDDANVKAGKKTNSSDNENPNEEQG
ncbi:MAG: hypothetical protein JNK81_04290 [Anaerolineales bacterium]|nr:hypothetical protein [Anaerolineales bacterium]